MSSSNKHSQKPNKLVVQAIVCVLAIIAVPMELLAQADASFTADTTQGCDALTVQFTNTGTPPGANIEYYWYFEAGEESTLENPSHIFDEVGSYEVKFAVTNTSTLDTDTTTQVIEVYQTPSASSLTVRSSSNLCINGVVRFQGAYSNEESVKWLFGDGQSAESDIHIIYENHVYSANNTYEAALVAYNGVCTDTAFQTVVIDGPHADIIANPAEACPGESVNLSMVVHSDVTSHAWNLEGDISTDNPVDHLFNTTGEIIVLLELTGSTKTCTIQDTVEIYQVDANFTLPDERCHLDTFPINESSVGADQFIWKLNGTTFSLLQRPEFVLSSGNYTLGLKVIHTDGCADSTELAFEVNDPPTITMSAHATICPGESTQLEASGGDIALWSPGISLDDSTSLTPTAQPDSNITYLVLVTESTTGCSGTDSVSVFVQSGFETGYITVGIYDSVLVDSMLIVGDSVGVWLTDSRNRTLSYTWEPDYMISCTDCPTPMLQPIQNTEYTLSVSDTNQCNASEIFTIPIKVRKEYYTGMQAAFTPNDDGINDVIGVDGWGIKTVLEFRIFNRNGNEVFFGDDINSSWDGNYNGNPQPAGVYMYLIKTEMWDVSEPVVSKGTFNLIR